MFLKRLRILLILSLFFTDLFAQGYSGAFIKMGIPGLWNLFDFEDSTKQQWEIDPAGSSGFNSLTKVTNSTGWGYNGSTRSLAFYIDCSIKDTNGELAGKGRVQAIDHTDLTVYNRFKIHCYLEVLQGNWGSDWLYINLYFWRKKDDQTWHGVFKGQDGLTPTWNNPCDISWDISSSDAGIGYGDPLDRDYVSEIGFEIKSGKDTSSDTRAILYIDFVQLTNE